jgi:hypothetical protein
MGVIMGGEFRIKRNATFDPQKPILARRSIGIAIVAFTFSVGLAVADETFFGWRPLLDRTLRTAKELKVDPSDMAHILVETGNEQQADEYYARITKKIGFDIASSHLDSLVEYLGYKGLHAVDLETLDPQLLSPQDQQGFTALSNSVENPAEFKANTGLTLAAFKSDALLSARFFAPKIVDFNAKPDTAPGHDPYKAGWRKLVRLNALPKSDAYIKGNIASAYLLFNFFSANPKDNPFPLKSADGKTLTNESVNNQVILVPRNFKKNVEDSIYFLDYQPFSVDRYKVGKALHAAFDTLDPNNGDTKQDYFVPTACSQCHGHDQERGDPNAHGNYSFGKVNYLDTDQWYDMMNFDFPNTKAQHDVVFDGNDLGHTSAKYKAAVGTFFKLNNEIVHQNETALRADGSDEFKILAAKKWISLHTKGEGPIDPLRRSIGKSAWANGELPLLQMLDRYCFRCHSSMYYDIFDRAAVLREKGTAQTPGPIVGYVSSGFMPQGRKLAQSEKDALVGYLKALK